jgi:hypothetical protein
VAILWVSGSKEQNYGSGNEFYNTNDGFELVKVSIKSLLKINAFYIFIVLIEIKFRVEFAAVCNSQIARMITIRYCVTSMARQLRGFKTKRIRNGFWLNLEQKWVVAVWVVRIG